MSRYHILVVNDSKLICEFSAMTLRDNGYRVTTAEDGAKALQTIAEEAPDLMVLDIQLRDMDGVQVATEMEKKVPFLIYGTLPDSDQRMMRLMELGGLGRASAETLLDDVANALRSG